MYIECNNGRERGGVVAVEGKMSIGIQMCVFVIFKKEERELT